MSDFTNLRIENISPVIELNNQAPDNKVLEEMRINELDTNIIGGSEQSFSQLLRNSLEKVNEYQADADQAIKELTAGRTKNVHETMLAVERADMSLKLMMQVRNKVVDAYREIMRMQV
jgi:flagellar hook-basal body complex protein FliE